MINDNLYNSSDIAERIKIQAKINKISISELLRKCDLGINTISKIAKGKDILSKNLAKIADCLDCSVDYLLCRTDRPDFKPQHKNNTLKIVSDANQPATTLMSLYTQPASAGSGNWLDYDNPVTYMTVVQDEQSMRADYMVKVQGDSMLPRFSDGDIVLIKKTPSIDIGKIGVFIVNGDSYIKKMGQGELVSVNPKYPNVLFNDNDDVRCAGEVIGVANCV